MTPIAIPLRARAAFGALALAALLLAPATARAYPALQLNILGGIYDEVSESIVTDADRFTVQAYATRQGRSFTKSEILDAVYYVSFAVTTPDGRPVGDFGTLSVDGVEIGIGDTTYGTPDGLPPHGVYAAHHYETAFRFDRNDRARPFDTAENAGEAPETSGRGRKMYFASFEVDASDLAPGVGLEIDLYGGEVTPNIPGAGAFRFAPFSHNAARLAGVGPAPSAVAEPGTLAALLTSLLALALCRRRPAPSPRRAASPRSR